MKHPVESVEPDSITVPEGLLLELVRYAKLVAHGRVEVTADAISNLEAGPREDPRRVTLLLQTLARGLALAEGRHCVMSSDLALLRHIALSSIPTKRRDLLRAALACGGTLDAGQVEKALPVSRPTALDRMKELGATGLCIFTPDARTSKPAPQVPSRQTNIEEPRS